MLKEKFKMMNGVLENGNYQLDQLEFVEKTNLEDHKSTNAKKTVKSGITFGSALAMVMIAIQLIHAAAVNCGCCLCIQNANCYHLLTCDKICDKRFLEGIESCRTMNI